MTITVLVVDDHPVVRTGLRAVLDAEEELSVVGEAATGEEAITLAEHLRPDVVLCDLRLGAGMDGIDVITALNHAPPAPAVVIVTTFDREAEIAAAIEAGAAGYLVKDTPPDTIVHAVRTAATGGTYLPPETSAKLLARLRNPRPRLTAREREVLRLLATGVGNKEIARELFVTQATVKSHLVRIFTKLDVDSRSRAVHVAQETGLI